MILVWASSYVFQINYGVLYNLERKYYGGGGGIMWTEFEYEYEYEYEYESIKFFLNDTYTNSLSFRLLYSAVITHKTRSTNAIDMIRKTPLFFVNLSLMKPFIYFCNLTWPPAYISAIQIRYQPLLRRWE